MKLAKQMAKDAVWVLAALAFGMVGVGIILAVQAIIPDSVGRLIFLGFQVLVVLALVSLAAVLWVTHAVQEVRRRP